MIPQQGSSGKSLRVFTESASEREGAGEREREREPQEGIGQGLSDSFRCAAHAHTPFQPAIRRLQPTPALESSLCFSPLRYRTGLPKFLRFFRSHLLLLGPVHGTQPSRRTPGCPEPTKRRLRKKNGQDSIGRGETFPFSERVWWSRTTTAEYLKKITLDFRPSLYWIRAVTTILLLDSRAVC